MSKVIFFLLLLALGACAHRTTNADGSDAGPAPSDGGTVALSPEQRAEALAALWARGVEALSGPKTSTEQTSRFVEAAGKIPHVAKAEVGAGGKHAVVTLVDGTALGLFGNRTFSGKELPEPEPEPDEGAFAKYELPRKPDAKLLTFAPKDTASKQQQRVLASQLTLAGYKVKSASMTIEELLDGAEVGVLYLDTHGMADQMLTDSRVTDAADKELVAVTTADADGNLYVSAEEQARLRAALAGSRSDARYDALGLHGDYFYGIAPINYGSGAVPVMRYTVRPSFFRRVKLAAHAMVYVDACRTASTDDFYAAFMAAGADVYLGWPIDVNDFEILTLSRRFFDRLLGTNREQPVSSPRHRPWDVRTTYDSFAGERSSEGVDLVLKSADTINLRPSIAYITTNPIGASFTLHGQFPPKGADGDPLQGMVKVGGMDVKCGTWTESKLDLCDLTPGGSALAGPVRVQYGPIKSNPRKLSRWQGTLTYIESGPGAFKKTTTLDFELRGDVQSFRTDPKAGPKPPPSFVWSFSDGKRVKCASTLEGSYAGCTMSGTPTSDYAAGTTGTLCTLKIEVDPSGVMRMTPTVKLYGAIACPSGGDKAEANMTAVPGLYDEPIGIYRVSFDPKTGEIPASGRKYLIPSAGLTYEIKWGPIKPESPPEDVDPR